MPETEETQIPTKNHQILGSVIGAVAGFAIPFIGRHGTVIEHLIASGIGGVAGNYIGKNYWTERETKKEANINNRPIER